MAQPQQTGKPIVTTSNPIADLLGAPLDSGWTVDRLAEQLLAAIAAQPAGKAQEFVLEEHAALARQSQRLLRPLLACLATKSAAEAGTSANLYSGPLSFRRSGRGGLVWILGDFENRPGRARVALRLLSSPPDSETRSRKPGAGMDAASGGESLPPNESLHLTGPA